MEKQQFHITELEIANRLDIFIKTVESGLFADAHESLEDHWRELRTTVEGRFLKGLINGATALELRRLGRVEAEKRVWKTFDKFMLLADELSFLKDEFLFTKDFLNLYRLQ